MKLGKIQLHKTCEALKQGLVDNGFLIKEKDIYTMTEPSGSVPQVYCFISPNGMVDDLGDIAEGILSVDIRVKLLQDRSINYKKLDKVIDSLDTILNNDLHIDNYYFTLSQRYKAIDYVDNAFGYSTKLINVFYRIKRDYVL